MTPFQEIEEAIKEIERQMDIIGNAKEKFTKIHSVADKFEDFMMHEAENFDFSASEAYKFYKTLKEARTDRRKAKTHLQLLPHILGNLKSAIKIYSKNINKNKHHQLKLTEKEITEHLRSVNKTDLKFRLNRHTEKMEKLFQKIRSN